MKRISRGKLRRFLSLIFSFLLVGLFAHHVFAKEKPGKRSTTSKVRPKKTQVLPQSPQAKDQEKKIQEEMAKYLGVRYKLGGNGTNGFDCSGFTKQIYSEFFGVDLPHQSSEQNQSRLLSTVSDNELKTGDLVFFSTGRSRKGINHVGVYLSDGRFIHSARTSGVVISSLDDPHWKARLVSTKRLLDRHTTMASMDPRAVGGLGIALNDKDLFTFQVTTAQSDSIYSSLTNPELSQFSRDSFYRTEFSFLKGLWVDSWDARLTAFREYFTLGQEDPFFQPRPILRGMDLFENSLSPGYTQGLKLASDIRATEWLRVSPSVTYFDYGSSVAFTDMPRVALGLDLNLASSSQGWSLSTGFQYPLSRYGSTRLSDSETADSHVIDMSLTFRQRLTDNIQFSVTGERFYKSSYGSRGSGFDADDHQVSFALRFFY